MYKLALNRNIYYRYKTRPVMSGPGLYDPTSIMNADMLNRCQREGWIKLAVYLLSFFYYLYGYEEIKDNVLYIIQYLIQKLHFQNDNFANTSISQTPKNTFKLFISSHKIVIF